MSSRPSSLSSQMNKNKMTRSSSSSSCLMSMIICSVLVWTATIATTTTLVVAAAGTTTATTTPASLSWTVYHSWDSDQTFQRRGVLTWTGSDSSTETDSNEDVPSTTSTIKKDDPTMKAGFRFVNDDEATITQKDVQDMLSYGWYHIKIQGSGSDGSDYTMATVPACNLRRANFKDQFDVTIPRTSSTSGSASDDRITSFAYSTLVSPLAPKTCDVYDITSTGDEDGEATTKTFSFSSKLSVLLDTPAMSIRPVLPTQSKPPPGLKFINKKNKNANQGGSKTTTGEGGATGDEEDDEENLGQPEPPTGIMGFLQKYWYLLLPMLIMNIMTAPPADEGQEVTPQQGGGGGAVQAAPQPAGSGGGGGGGGGNNKRRGKRN